MNKKPIRIGLIVTLICCLFTSCAFYDYPETKQVAKKGEMVYGFQLLSVKSDHITFDSRTDPITLKINESMSAGNNRHIVLDSTNSKENTATFTLSQLDYHGGFLSMPPF